MICLRREFHKFGATTKKALTQVLTHLTSTIGDTQRRLSLEEDKNWAGSCENVKRIHITQLANQY